MSKLAVFVFSIVFYGVIVGIEHKFTPIPKGALPWGEGLKMMRRGQSGSSSEMLTPAQQKRIDAHFEEELGRLGSDFPYARLFAARNSHV